MRQWLIGLLEWVTGENIGGLKESLRITTKISGERERALLKLHELLTPGEDWYSWQRVYQNTERVLKVVCAADRLDQRLAEFDGRSGCCSEYFDALSTALTECQGTWANALAEE